MLQFVYQQKLIFFLIYSNSQVTEVIFLFFDFITKLKHIVKHFYKFDLYFPQLFIKDFLKLFLQDFKFILEK